ncbi:hypothetical protein ACYOEI_00050 [Singulisphaera rosea]
MDDHLRLKELRACIRGRLDRQQNDIIDDDHYWFLLTVESSYDLVNDVKTLETWNKQLKSYASAWKSKKKEPNAKG